jgi:hypothetical protein
VAFVHVLEVNGIGTADADAVSAAVAGNARLMGSIRDWQRQHGTSPGGAVTDVLRIKAMVLDSAGTDFAPTEIVLGPPHALPVDIALAVLRHGSAAVTAILRTALSYRMNPEYGRQILSALEVVERWMADELARIEARASVLAQAQIETMHTRNRQFRARFREVRFSEKTPSHVLDLPPATKATLFSLLYQTRKHRTTIAAMTSEIERRDRIDGPTPEARIKARKASPARAAHVELFAGPYRAASTALMDLDEKIFAIFPPALAIIGEAGADLKDWVPYADALSGQMLAMLEIEQKYDARIYAALVAHDRALKTVATSLRNATCAAWAKDYFRLSPDARRDAGGLIGHVQARLLAEAPGAWDRLANVLTEGPLFGTLASDREEAEALEENHVMARQPVILAMVAQGFAAGGAQAETLLLSAFSRDLARAQTEQVANERASAARWRIVELALALAGLVVGLVTLPFGVGEAILPASLGMISTVVVGTLIVGSIALMARSVMSELSTSLRANVRLRDRLLECGRNDPEALEAVALFLTTRRDVARKIGETALESLIDIASQRLLPPLALALDLRDHYQAMDTLTLGLADLRGQN